MKKYLLILSLLAVILGVSPLPQPSPVQAAAPQAAISAPVLKWAYGGCNSLWCDTGWYASPAAVDVDKDGQVEVIWGGYDLSAINGSTGVQEWRADASNRIWPGIGVADLTGDGNLEIIVGRSGNQVTVYNASGTALWTRSPFSGGEVRTLALGDVDGNGSIEIIVGRASGGSTLQVSVYDANGNVRPGWPARHDGEAGYGWGMYNQNVTLADLNNDGSMEILAPTDTHYITGLNKDGGQLPANSMYGAGKVWAQVGVHVDHTVDLRGYADCGVEHRPNFANSAPAIADLDGNGSKEIIVPGDVYNCGIEDGPLGDLYIMPFLFNLDRTRWSGSGFDWTVLPTPEPNATPLSEDYDVIENNVQNAVPVDLDNDGEREILFPSYDGRLHAYWLDKTQHGAWPYDVPGSGIRFASEPVVADLNGDGYAEVIFTSWGEKASNSVGQLHILDYLGHSLFAVNLPNPGNGTYWNGGLGAPTLANIDSDADLEVVIGTTHSGVVAYDLPNTANARILWGTGRGTLMRAGTPPALCSHVITSVSPAEGGAITSSSPNCGSDFTPGTSVQFTITPAAGYKLLAVTGLPSGAASQNLTLYADRRISAIFIPESQNDWIFLPLVNTTLP